MKIRKYLFLGLTLVLVVALANLIYHGRQEAKKEAAKSAEVIRQSKPTPTRILGPEGIAVVNPVMERDASGAAVHSMAVRNDSSYAYGQIRLQFVYRDRNGKVLERKTQTVAPGPGPGASLSLSGIRVEGVPPAAVQSDVSIVSADLAEPGNQHEN